MTFQWSIWGNFSTSKPSPLSHCVIVYHLQTPRKTRCCTRVVETFIRVHNDNNSATIVGAVVYIAVNIRHTNFCIYGWTLLKISIILKKVQIKVVQNSISYKKLSGRICLSPQGVELGGFIDWHVWNTGRGK